MKQITLNDEEVEFIKMILTTEVEIDEDLVAGEIYDVWSIEELRKRIQISKSVLAKL